MTVAAREQQLLDWFRGWSDSADATLVSVSGDASFRRYFRARRGAGNVVLVDSPPDKEKNPEFIAIQRALVSAGIRVPAIYETDLQQGFFALEDLGDQLLLPLLTDENADIYYHRALQIHRRLARAEPGPFNIPVYDAQELTREMNLFVDWFCPQLLGLVASSESQRCYEDLRLALCDRAIAQPQVVVHRDFHARNFMVLESDELAIIDFQDAILGPVTYDLVSLLKDCYVRWPRQRVRDWVLEQHEAMLAEGIALPSAEGFLSDFHWMGLQRHLKVLGIFARLYLRDGKAAYLSDLPRVMAYVREVLGAYPDEPAFMAFARWFERSVVPAARRQAWFTDEAEP